MDSIDWDTKVWKTSLVRELFDVEIADGICQISLGSIHNEYRKEWGSTTNVEFTIRSAYHLQKEILALDQGECSRADNHKLNTVEKYMDDKCPSCSENILVEGLP